MDKTIDESEKELPLISRESAERHVPFEDCGGLKYDDDLREDIIRYVLVGAEIQRDKDFETLLRRYNPNEFERLRKKYEWSLKRI